MYANVLSVFVDNKVSSRDNTNSHHECRPVNQGSAEFPCVKHHIESLAEEFTVYRLTWRIPQNDTIAGLRSCTCMPSCACDVVSVVRYLYVFVRPSCKSRYRVLHNKESERTPLRRADEHPNTISIVRPPRPTPRKYVFDVTSVGQRKYVFDVTSAGQRSSPWPCKLGESRYKISPPVQAPLSLCTFPCSGNCIELTYQ